MNVPSIFTPEAVKDIATSMSRKITEEPTGKEMWVPCRPMGNPSLGFFHRLIVTWRVFTGQYDVVKWKQQ